MAEPTLQEMQSLTVGTAVYSCSNYSSSSKPVLGSSLTVVGRELSIEGVIEVSADSEALLAVAIADAGKSLTSLGKNVVIKCFGVVTAQILAAWCANGGPRIEYKVLEQTLKGLRTISFTVVGSTNKYGDNTVPTANPPATVEDATGEVSTATASCGLDTVSADGEFLGDGSSTMASAVVASYLATYAWPKWSVDRTIQSSAGGGGYKYSVVAKELATALPAHGSTRAVDGTITIARETDVRRARTTTTYSCDLVCNSDPADLADALRPAPTGYQMLTRDSVSITRLPQWRLSATWVIEASSEGGFLSDWQQLWDQEGVDGTTQQTIREITMPGSTPVLVYAAKPAYRYVQRGKSTGVGVYIKPPMPMFGDFLETAPKVSFNRSSNIDKETTWEYHFVSLTPLVVKSSDLERPLNPEVW